MELLNKAVFKLTLFTLLFFGWSCLATFLLGLNIIITVFGDRIFALFLSKQPETYNKVVGPMKKKLFTELNSMKLEGGKSKLKILEVGGGSGANFKFWNGPAEIDVVDPNPFMSQYFEETRAKFTGGKLVINPMKKGYGEDLKSIGIEDGSYDAVVMTLVFCSVADEAQCIKEVQRVLRPGGKFFFLDHTIAEQGDSLRMVQQALMIGGFWPSLFCGCCLDKDTYKTIEDVGGWSKLEQTKFDMPETNEGLLKYIRYIIRPHFMGVAEK